MKLLKYILLFIFSLLLNKNVSATEIVVVENENVFFEVSHNQTVSKEDTPSQLERLIGKIDANKVDLLLDDIAGNTSLRKALVSNDGLIDAWERVLRTASNGAPILRKDIDVLTALGKFDNNLVNKIGADKFDDFLSKLIDAHPKCKTCGNSGDALVGNLDEVLDNFHKVVTQRAIKPDGSLINGFDDFIIEAGEQASKAKGASLTLSKMADDVTWSELTNGGWELNRFEGSIPDIETGHKLDALFKRTNPTTGATEFKSVEMKNWSSARSVSGSTYSQFKAYITSGNGFEYYFSNGLSDAMKGNFQNVFKDASKASELFNANPSFFTSQNISNATILNNLANQGQLLNHPTFMNFVR